MDTHVLTTYRHAIRTLLDAQAHHLARSGEDAEIIADEMSDNYQVLLVGWHDGKRIFTPAIHLRIRHGQVWIEHNGGPDDIAAELVAAGVPREQIVLTFHPAWKQPLTGYGVAEGDGGAGGVRVR